MYTYGIYTYGMYTYGSDATCGWAGWALAHPEFRSSVNLITTRRGGGQIMPTTLPLAHPDLKTQWHLCMVCTPMVCIPMMYTHGIYTHGMYTHGMYTYGIMYIVHLRYVHLLS